MNAPNFKNISCSGVLVLLALAGGWPAQPLAAQDAAAPTIPPAPASASASTATWPAGILPASPLAQVLKLAQAGVDEGIIQAYVTNSTSTFNLDADKIIYLKDAGVPNDLVKGMIERDIFLQAQMTAAGVQPPPPPAPPAPPTPPPVVADDSQPPDALAAPAADVTVTDLYNGLTPYGNWVNLDGYGVCWQPGVAIYNPNWQPYGDQGHWVYTDSGWYWASDYAWGWAPFHYGRWFHHASYGWCWRPDTLWGPAWVVWSYNDAYCGWAPLPPGAVYSDTLGLIYGGAAVDMGFDFGLSPDSFVFVSLNYFGNPHPFQHRLNRDQARQVYRQTPIINQFERRGQGFVNRGIDPASIVRVTHTTIQPVMLQAASRVNGRFTPGGPAARAGAAVAPNRPQAPGGPSAANLRNDPAVMNNPQTATVIGNRYNQNIPGPGAGRSQAPVNNGQGQERFAPTASVPNNLNVPVQSPRTAPPVAVNRPYYPEPAPRPEPQRPAMPLPENRPVERQYPVERVERPAAPPAPAAAQAPAQGSAQGQAQTPAAKSNKNGNQ